MHLQYFEPLCDRLRREQQQNGWTLDEMAYHLAIPAGRLSRILAVPGRLSIEDARALHRYWPHNSWYQISGREEADMARVVEAAFLVRRRNRLVRLFDRLALRGMRG